MFNQATQSVIDRVDALRDQVDDHWQIPAEQGLLMAQIVRIGRSRSLLEVGVSYGFSTLHLSAAAKDNGGHVHAIDIAEKKVRAATAHLTEAGLIDAVTVHLGDARQIIPTLQPKVPFDFLFIDAAKEQSIDYLEAARPKLAPRCLIVADNTGDLASQMRPFVEHVRGLPGARSCEIAMGHGFELTVLDQG